MKNIKKTIYKGILCVLVGFTLSSCDWLSLTPIDYYGSETYWTNESHISGYMDGIHKHLRDASYQHIRTFGELRGGTYVIGLSPCGNSTNDNGISNQSLDENKAGVSNWGALYGRIFNLNLLIEKVLPADYIDEAKKGYYLGQAYGLRAFYYFDLYRVYGGVPLQLTPDVINGIIQPEQLYKERSSPKVIMAQIKSDLDESMKYFGAISSFDPHNRGHKKSYWSRAATECLMGEVYLWTSKVTTGDDEADVSNLVKAEEHLLNVISDYSLSLQPKFTDVFFSDKAGSQKGNSEVIMAIRYAEGEKTNYASEYVYHWMSSKFDNAYQDANGKVYDHDTLEVQSTGNQWNAYRKELFTNYEALDTRRDATFLPLYNLPTATANPSQLEGVIYRKNIGYVAESGVRTFVGDEIFYRLPWVYLTLAEIENMKGGDVAKYINKVRERAYGADWDATDHGYTDGSFTANELAILSEKDKEFVLEGQRWWDIRRMTLTKGGEHLVFCKESSLDGLAPILDKATQSHKVLWPVDVEVLNKDPKLKQTPGYGE